MAKSSPGSVRRLRSARYQTRVSVNDRIVSLGTFPTRPAATTAIAHATAPAAPSGRQTPPMRVDAWIKNAVSDASRHRASTRERHRGILDSAIVPGFGGDPLAELTATDIRAWVNELGSRLAPGTVQRG